MRRIYRFFHYIILLVFCQLLVFLGGSFVSAADVDDFYFEDFTADYYLSKNSEGVSRLKVVENLTVVFPIYDQNKGICRKIASTNSAGKNVTLSQLDEDDIVVLRNGDPEPIYSIKNEGQYYEVCTGTDDYVHGEQIYTFEYEQTKVITDFDDYQELYWDVNGNEWKQRFDRVVARVHLGRSVEDNFDDEIGCYVGKFGENGEERCEAFEIFDGVEFVANNLDVGETLTFVMAFKAGAFVVPPPELNYVAIIIIGAIVIICGVIIYFAIKKFIKTREKRKYYHDLFVKPEYQPEPNYSLAEMTEVYIGKKQNVKVGMILDLVVRKRIRLIKGEQKRKWLIEVLNIDDTTKEERILLEILNGGDLVNSGDRIEIKKHLATTSMIALGEEFETLIRKKIKAAGLVGKEYKTGQSIRRGNLFLAIIGYMIACLLGSIFATFVLYSMLSEYGIDLESYGAILGDNVLLVIILFLFVVSFTVAILWYQSDVFLNQKFEGLRMSRYMDGLKMYIKMAETDRLKVLQSVEGADVSPEGVIKIYEKLLPYAAVFGLEKSWMKEMRQYCELHELDDRYWLTSGLTISELSRVANYASHSIDGSSGFSSSGSSGLGGGGFAGGGGGGGGGGGR